MNFVATKAAVLNRGTPPDAFLTELVEWGRKAPDIIFAPNPRADIYSKTVGELGPWRDIIHRKGAMLEVMRVLAGFESSWDWNEGVDTSRIGQDTASNSEAGAWQVSFDARNISRDLRQFLDVRGIQDGVKFQRLMKSDHELAMEFVARLMRFTTRHNGPLYKGDERNAIRESLRGPEHSIYPWLSRDACTEFRELLVA